MISDEQRKEINELKALAIAVGQKAKHLRNLGVDVQMSLNRTSLVVHKFFVMREITDEELLPRDSEYQPPKPLMIKETAALVEQWNEGHPLIPAGNGIGLDPVEAADRNNERNSEELPVVEDPADEQAPAEEPTAQLAEPRKKRFEPDLAKRPNVGMAKAINTAVANVNPEGEQEARVAIAYKQGNEAEHHAQNPYNQHRSPDMHEAWLSGWNERHTPWQGDEAFTN